MPVIPHGVPAYEIRPPCTIGDDGAPSDSLTNDVDRVFLLIEDERHLTAETLLTSVHTRIADWEKRQTTESSLQMPLLPKPKKGIFNGKKGKEAAVAREKKAAEMQQLKDFLASKHSVFKTLEVRN